MYTYFFFSNFGYRKIELASIYFFRLFANGLLCLCRSCVVAKTRAIYIFSSKEVTENVMKKKRKRKQEKKEKTVDIKTI